MVIAEKESVTDGNDLQTRTLAPIVLFVYNRPDHTRRVVESLHLNRLSSQSELIVFSDGPKNPSDRDKVRDVRNIFQGVKGFLKVTLKCSDHNRGLAASIIEGVTSVINQYGRVIVIEDDLVISPCFLDYMNDALDFYADHERVMHVSGYWFPINAERLPETFFLSVPSSWGWGTWERAWQHFSKNPKSLVRSFSRDDIQQFNLDGANDFWEQVVHNLKGKSDSWAIFWYATIFRRNGLCLYPSMSLVHNEGLDGSGVHCLRTNRYSVALSDGPLSVQSRDIDVCELAFLRLQKFYRDNRVSRLRRFAVSLCQKLGIKIEL